MKPSPTARTTDARRKTEGALPLICPVCEQTLSWGDRACVCPQGHSFDLAREGYLNLLLSNLRRSKHPGDNADMVQARRRFLDCGAFAQLSELIQSEVRQLLAGWEGDRRVNMADLGCGEGHFLGALQGVVTGPFYGVDVSKEAIRVAARRHRSSRWVVANVMRRIPFACDSLDIILSVLAPRNVEELARILEPNGSLLLVVPGPNHLLELRSRLMADTGNFQTKADAAVELCAPRFAIRHKRSLTYEVLLKRDLLADLVQMTPLFWRSTREAKGDMGSLDELRVTMSFVLLAFTLIR
jgi:23S rRNA (guanine745-N1)-methyltransferase